MSAPVDPIDMRFPGESEPKRKLRKRILAAWLDAMRRSENTGSGFASVVLQYATQFADRWVVHRDASEQQLQDVLIALSGLFIAANAFERAADGRPY